MDITFGEECRISNIKINGGETIYYENLFINNMASRKHSCAFSN